VKIIVRTNPITKKLSQNKTTTPALMTFMLTALQYPIELGLKETYRSEFDLGSSDGRECSCTDCAEVPAVVA